MIPYGRQDLDDDDIAAVVEVLRGEWLTSGPTIGEFEHAIAARVEARHAVAFSNGTAALHGAMAAGGIGSGDTVVTSPLTFVASANCARYVGADVQLVDIDPETWNLDLRQLPECDAVVAVDFAGLPVDWSTLRSRPRLVVEDSAHALGATTPEGPVGNGAHADMSMFSFHPVKHVTTAEGGIITTNDDDLAAALRRFRNHGAVPIPEQGGWYYEVVDTGYNYRLTDVQAALGVSQLKKLDGFLARRRALADRYRALLADLPVQLPPGDTDGRVHAYHLFPILVEERRRVYERLRAVGIGVQVHYVPLYRHPILAHLGPPERFPHTEHVYERILSLPLFPALSDAEQDRVVHELEAALS